MVRSGPDPHCPVLVSVIKVSDETVCVPQPTLIVQDDNPGVVRAKLLIKVPLQVGVLSELFNA